MFCARVGRHVGWPSGLRGLVREQQENPGNVFSLVPCGGPSWGVVAAAAPPLTTDDGATLLPRTGGTVFVSGRFSGATTAFGGGGGIMNDDISSDVSTLAARFSSGLPLACGSGGGGMVIVAKNDSRSKFIRFVLFLNP